jgi:hypothetical protein
METAITAAEQQQCCQRPHMPDQRKPHGSGKACNHDAGCGIFGCESE